MRKLLLGVGLAGLLVGCGSQPMAPVAGEPARAAVPVEARAISPYSVLTDPASPLFHRSVYFDFDEYTVKPEYRELLVAHGNFLRQHPELRMMIQGHADDRGSREYNLALGQLRAEAIVQALRLMGIPEGQLEAVSFGEERPQSFDPTEAGWAQNRRGDLLYSGEF